MACAELRLRQRSVGAADGAVMDEHLDPGARHPVSDLLGARAALHEN